MNAENAEAARAARAGFPAPVRAVVAAPEPDRVVRAVQNLVAAADRPVEVEVVAYGAGLDLVLGEESGEQVTRLLETGARVLACANSLSGRGLTADILVAGVGVVPAAVWHLALRQHEGWSLVPLG
ncbi:DsrE family protein [Streptomyces sp. NPDC088337]|uniref:DsrE family protein n=1 Tax=unclassified Streptomyces TaxID=2593676 RepID=UPI002DD888C4|nr:DsrE family protein [Streptomyces sp. NBC_01788]WSB30601.1 DsrE family protein [Streptomyces sp. NBC_01788]